MELTRTRGVRDTEGPWPEDTNIGVEPSERVIAGPARLVCAVLFAGVRKMLLKSKLLSEKDRSPC